MKKGTIMTIDQKFAYIFTTDCKMEKVAWQPGMSIGKEINMKTNTSESTARTFSGRRTWGLALAVACLVILLVGGILAGQGLIFNPVYARLSIDVNPSVEFALNRQLKVHEVRTMNEDARQVLAGEDLTGLPWQQAVARWTELLKLRYKENIQEMLIAAVVPAEAVQLTEQLMAMERTANQGELQGLQVRVVYSQDPAVVKTARQNGLSVGRQMLLNQSEQQKQGWTAESIADAPLGDLVRKLLRDGEADQTGMTRRTTQSLSDPSGSEGQQTGETSRETSGQESENGSQNTKRETNRETENGSQSSMSGTPAICQASTGEPSGSTNGSKPTNQYANQETSQTSGTQTQTSGSGSANGGT
jgi:hypothetical protein